MKTIVNKLRFVLLLGFSIIGLAMLAQNIANIEKMSTTTQMFLDEMTGKISLENPQGPNFRIKSADGQKQIPDWRPIARPINIDGESYISAFVRITNESDIKTIERMGVIVECQFDNGLLTALIPIDMIDELAALDCVTRINIASLKKPLTNMARQTTNADDVLAYTADAIAASLPHGYDGTGVLLGIIDSGIDFQHIAFKDKDGNPRIKRAIRYNGSTLTEYTGTGNLPTADATDSDHGTHTSSIAGGSSVIVNGTTVTVTDNHANATYGGMAPGTDLYLCGIANLNDTYIAQSFQKICNYGDSQNQPVVISNSWGSSYEDHDGNSEMSDLFAQYFGDNHPNHICLFASGNEAGMAESGYPGGYYLTGNSTSNAPLGTIIKTQNWVVNQGVKYYGLVANAWTRATDATGIGINIYVLNASGTIVRTYNYTSSSGAQQFTPQGMSGTLNVGFYTSSVNGKKQVLLSTNYLQDANNNNNVLAIEVYPIGGSSSVVDIWGGTYSYLSNYLTTNGHTWTAGIDDVSVGDEASDKNVISVGSYVSRYANDNSAGDISSFSSYVKEGVGPSGRIQPWITAPGEILISAMNHSATSHDVDQVIVNSTTSPYGSMSGTSMATPAAAGIVALWMQAAHEIGKDMTVNDIKNVMKESAIHDSWTNGTHASHFGHGKIDALGGIEYILEEYGEPAITVTPSTVTFDGAPGGTYIQTVTVGGVMLTNDIIAELNDPNGVYSINRSVNLGSGGTLTITYSPQTQGTHNATITLTSAGAPDATITINGTSREVTEATVADGTQTNSYLPIYGNQYNSRQINQMIYPANMLTDIQGKKIKSMTFYPTTPLNFYGGAFTVKIGSTTQTTFPNSTYSRITGLTTVKTGQAAVRNDNLLVIEFNEPFEYTGGNLVIDFEVTATGTRSSSQNFYGINPGSYTSFNSYGTSTNTYGRYGSGSRRQFLPKVTFKWDAPYVEGNVTPTTLTYSNVIVGRSAEQTVTVSNTGTLNFTPVIDTSNLPAEFTVSGTQFLTPGNSFNLTVTYTPTDEGSDSGSFTVTIGNQTFTVTVTGNGIQVNNTLLSNEVTVPVYKTAIEVLTPYSLQDLDDDIDHSLVVDVTNSDVNIKVTRDAAITRYDVYHNEDVKDSGQNWATGGINRAVSYSTVTSSNDSYVYLPYAKDQDDLTQWVQQPSVSMSSSDDEMWVHLNDYVTVQNAWTWYVPVVVADGIVTTGNTYGAPIMSSRLGSVSAVVSFDQSTTRQDEATGQQYYYMTAQVEIQGTAPEVDADADYHYECYKARAWRIWTPYIIGVGAQPQTETYMGEVTLSGITAQAIIGDKDFHATSTGWVLGEPVFCSPVGTEAMFVSRLYYKRVPNNANAPRRAGGGGGGGGGGGSAPGGGPVPPSVPTGLASLDIDKHVVGTTYVNTLGMTSDRPFEGMNIVVTRYSDGTTSTVKVFK